MQPENKICIAIAEDNTINTNAFLQKMQLLQHYELVFIATNGSDCLEQLKSLPEDKIPQVVFMDLEMPLLDGIQTITKAHPIYPKIHFIVLTVFDDEEKIFEAIKAGASGYLLKHEKAEVLDEAIRNVLEFGGAPLSPAIARKAMQLLSKSSSQAQQKSYTSLPSNITEREKEILEQMVKGWDAKRIGASLFVSVLTVRKHIANIYDKLHLHSKAQVISLAHREKWFEE